MTQLYNINLKLSNAYQMREIIVPRVTKDSLSENDTLYVPSYVVKRLEKNRELKKGSIYNTS